MRHEWWFGWPAKASKPYWKLNRMNWEENLQQIQAGKCVYWFDQHVKIGTLFGVDDLEMLAVLGWRFGYIWNGSKVGANRGSEMVKHMRSQDKTSQSSIYQESSINPENHMLVQNLPAQIEYQSRVVIWRQYEIQNILINPNLHYISIHGFPTIHELLSPNDVPKMATSGGKLK